jgi:putative transposase
MCRVLREQGCPLAARTCRCWTGPSGAVASRAVTEACVEDRARELAGTLDTHGRPRRTPEGL